MNSIIELDEIKPGDLYIRTRSDSDYYNHYFMVVRSAGEGWLLVDLNAGVVWASTVQKPWDVFGHDPKAFQRVNGPIEIEREK